MNLLKEIQIVYHHMFANVYHGESCFWCRLKQPVKSEEKIVYPFEGELDSAGGQQRLLALDTSIPWLEQHLFYVYGLRTAMKPNSATVFELIITQGCYSEKNVKHPTLVITFGDPLPLAFEYKNSDGCKSIQVLESRPSSPLIVFCVMTREKDVQLSFFASMVLRKKYISLDTLYTEWENHLKHTQEHISCYANFLVDLENTFFSAEFVPL